MGQMPVGLLLFFLSGCENAVPRDIEGLFFRGGGGCAPVCEGEAAHDAFWDRWNTGLESIGEGRRADASP